MRLLIAATILLLPIGTSAAQDRPRPAKPVAPSIARPCESAPVRHAEALGPPRVSRLGDLPPGDLHLALLREVDGCPEPVIVAYDFGLPGRASSRAGTPPERADTRPK